ncbi:hypothetical protein [Paenibacillus sp. NFR01]|uniref:hypothetical protein n=1 Tax=Paenibacillus sp. NFR01 TaxID=1566279 RepID=UPI0008B370BB|nr:hypothetical protein [Paenibacillus sp. NFR01]SET56179.1 hypothetical protein SAMN03159358_2028 [Paenibacillus sp. NFR01]
MKHLKQTASASAVVWVGTPEQIKANLSAWINRYGRDMPLSYILSLAANPPASRVKAG